MTETAVEAGQALFLSAENAITFALHFADQQSPSTPMSRILKRAMTGTGKGLVGIAGAHQAGAIQGLMLRELKPIERAILVVKFGDVRSTCPCCGYDDAPARSWSEAVEVVSHIEPLDDMHPRIRHAVVEKIVCRRKLVRVASLASKYEASERTIRERMRRAKPELASIENRALSAMQDMLQARGVVTNEESAQ